MFVDIDLPETKPPGLFKRLFGKPDFMPPTNQQAAAMTRIENWTRNHPEWGWRIYRTRAGLRLLATQGLVDADSDTADGVFEALGSRPALPETLQDAKMFPGAADTKTLALRHPHQAPTLAVVERQRGKIFQKMGGAIQILCLQLGDL